MSDTVDNCWLAQLRSTFDGLVRKAAFQEAVTNMQPVELQDFIPDLRARHTSVWRDVAFVDPCTVNTFAYYECWMALPLWSRSMSSAMLPVPKYLYLNLLRHVQRNVSCFRLRAHRLAGTCVCVCVCVCARAHMRVACVCVCVCAYARVHECVYARACVCASV